MAISSNGNIPLLSGLVCDVCLNSGLTRNRLTQKIFPCPAGCRYASNDAMLILAKTAFAKQDAGEAIDFLAFDIARILCRFTSAEPCSRRQLEELFFEIHPRENYGDAERKIKGYIETLRSGWLLPIGSRKSAPAGYWIITSLDEFKEWVERAKSAPITQLSTIHKVARHNFPVFAEQLELEFWSDLKGGDDGATA